MWIFTTTGFYSVVAHRQSAQCVLVRARERGDLERLLEECHAAPIPAILGGAGIVEVPGDYRFRVAVSRPAFAAWLAQQAMTIDYDNFKAAAARKPWWSLRMPALHAIWGELARATGIRRSHIRPKPRHQGEHFG